MRNRSIPHARCATLKAHRKGPIKKERGGMSYCSSNKKLGDWIDGSCTCGAAKEPSVSNNVGECSGWFGSDTNITCATPGAVITTHNEGGWEQGLFCTPPPGPPPLWCYSNQKLGDGSCHCGDAKEPSVTNNVGECGGGLVSNTNITCETPGAVISAHNETGLMQQWLFCTPPPTHPTP